MERVDGDPLAEYLFNVVCWSDTGSSCLDDAFFPFLRWFRFPLLFFPFSVSLSLSPSSVTEIFASLAQSRLASIQSTSRPFVVSLVLDPSTRFSKPPLCINVFNFRGFNPSFSILPAIKIRCRPFHDNAKYAFPPFVTRREKLRRRDRASIDTFRPNDIEYRSTAPPNNGAVISIEIFVPPFSPSLPFLSPFP